MVTQQTATRHIYLVDYENVGPTRLCRFLHTVKSHIAHCDNEVIIFYSGDNNVINFDDLTDMNTGSVRFVKIYNGSKNALDFQLASYLGAIIASHTTGVEYIIVSDDRGYECLANFWAYLADVPIGFMKIATEDSVEYADDKYEDVVDNADASLVPDTADCDKPNAKVKNEAKAKPKDKSKAKTEEQSAFRLPTKGEKSGGKAAKKLRQNDAFKNVLRNELSLLLSGIITGKKCDSVFHQFACAVSIANLKSSVKSTVKDAAITNQIILAISNSEMAQWMGYMNSKSDFYRSGKKKKKGK